MYPLPPFSVRDLFLDSLRDCLGLKRVPFNTSLVNDYMKRRDRRWNVQRELGCSFAQLCQVCCAFHAAISDGTNGM